MCAEGAWVVVTEATLHSTNQWQPYAGQSCGTFWHLWLPLGLLSSKYPLIPLATSSHVLNQILCTLRINQWKPYAGQSQHGQNSLCKTSGNRRQKKDSKIYGSGMGCDIHYYQGSKENSVIAENPNICSWILIPLAIESIFLLLIFDPRPQLDSWISRVLKGLIYIGYQYGPSNYIYIKQPYLADYSELYPPRYLEIFSVYFCQEQDISVHKCKNSFVQMSLLI